ncbi:MAG: phosphate ABC transporter ATP-binding protein [Chloroflexi bacterium]|nr:phosphate ABC transporter ATP-binding protein [Chloroflexota bacterium]
METQATQPQDVPTSAPGESVLQEALSSLGREPQDESQIIALETEALHVFYGDNLVLADITMQIPARRILAIIGPSGCGKSTLLRVFNRMNEVIPSARLEGQVRFMGQDLYAPNVDATEVRFRIGMVFQKPNPFPKSIYDNVAFGPRINGYRGNLDDLVEQSLKQAVLWDEVKDRMKKSALELSGGQQQRLCIARTLAVQPEVILMDEPASALDPAATLKIEDLMQELVRNYTIVIVTHNMQQAARVSDLTAFLSTEGGGEPGRLIEFGSKDEIFTTPKDQRTQDYITGRFG